MKPYLGALVHYVVFCDRQGKDIHIPAIINRIEEDSVHVYAFYLYIPAETVEGVKYDKRGSKLWTWHWPES